MKRCFDTVTIVGVGLLGGSLGLAMKKRGLAAVVRGVGHRRSSLDTAREVGAVDETFLDVRPAAKDADLIVLCTPATTVVTKLDELLPVCSPSAVVTDVASTKAVICEHAQCTWPKPLRFIGSHPMAGSEKFGPEHGDAELYEGCVSIVASCANQDPQAYETVCGLWESVGSRVVRMEPALHDAMVARTSHIPHIMAACLAQLAARAGDVRPVVGKGFRDATRIAAGRPEVWRDICLTNRQAILEGLCELQAQLEQVRRTLTENCGEAMEVFFRQAQVARSRVTDE